MPKSCAEIEHLLQQRLDRRDDAWPAELNEHLADCAGCQQFAAEWREIATAIATWREVVPPRSLGESILAQVRHESTASAANSTDSRSKFPAHGGRSIAALVAALALMLLVTFGWRVSQTATVARVDSAPSRVAQRDKSANGETDLQQVLQDAREAYQSLATEAWQQVSAANELLPSAEFPVPISGETSRRRASEVLPQPLGPISTELREVWGALLDRVFSNSQDSST